MKKYLNRKNIIIFSIVTLIALIFSLFYKPKPPLPQLISSSPISNAQRVSLTDSIQLKFDQDIDSTRLVIKSSPPEDWSIQVGNDNSTIILKSKKYLQVETSYSLSILYGDKSVSTLNFKTIPQQGDPRYTQGVLKEMDRDYPLAVKLPYNTPSYRVVYSAPLTLEITLKNQNISSATAIGDIKAWVTQNGGDASSHKYVIGTDPLPSPAIVPTKAGAAVAPVKETTPQPSQSLFEYLPAE